jgi:aminoglycoside phosphotransferase (APT) family kinase protein
VTLAQPRDLGVLRDGIDGWLAARRPSDRLRVVQLDRPAVGWSCETVIATVETQTGTDRVVVRLPPVAEAIFPTYDLAVQAAAQDLAARHGVPTASPVTFEPDPAWLGAPFLAMPFVEGHIPGEFVAGDPWIAGLGRDDQAGVWSAVLAILAAIHAIDWRDAPFAARLRGASGGLAEELAWWDRYLEWSTDGAPDVTLRDALGWCAAHAPVREPSPSLLWGDVRLGNMIFDGATRRPRAVLDWDMVSVGPAEMDLAWLLALESVPAELAGLRVEGFLDHEPSVRRFERQLGRPVGNLAWYEIFALVRSTAILHRIRTLFRATGRDTPHAMDVRPILGIIDRRIGAYRPSDR